MDTKPSFEFFNSLSGKTVGLKTGEAKLDATIVEVTAGTRHGDAERDPFSVIFVTESEENHGQGIYSLRYESAEPMDIFLVPLGPKSGGMSYEAIFT